MAKADPTTQEAVMIEVPTKPLDEIQKFVRRFVVFADETHYDALALWILHTWAFDAAYSTPYFYVHSAEPQSGKTRVLEVASMLARNAQSTANLTAAAMFRRMADSEPTLFIDEVDTIFTGAANEELRGVLNSGYKTGGSVSRYTGLHVEDFPTFCPKMLVGIDNGAMPDTLKDRTIPIMMKRKKTDQQVERMKYRDIDPQAEELRNRLRAWATHNFVDVMNAPDPEFIDGISDRKFEIVEPLLVLALVAGGKQYSTRMRKAFRVLLAGEAPKQSIGIQTLEAAKELFEEGDVDRVASADLADKMQVNPKKLGTILAKYDIRPATLRFKGRYAKGYSQRDFQDAWERYL